MSENVEEAARMLNNALILVRTIREMEEKKSLMSTTVNSSRSLIKMSWDSSSHIPIPNELKFKITQVSNEYYDEVISKLKGEINQDFPGLFKTEEPTRKLEL